MAKSEISSPGTNHLTTIGGVPSGKQDKGEVDIHPYCEVNTGKGGSGTISTEMNTPLGKTPTGAKTGGL